MWHKTKVVTINFFDKLFLLSSLPNYVAKIPSPSSITVNNYPVSSKNTMSVEIPNYMS